MSSIDATRFPRLAEYVANLPNGLRSHPEALINADALDYMRETQPQLAELRLPQAMVDTLAGKGGKWVPEVLANALYMAMRDAALTDDESFFRWSYESSMVLFKKPLYRMLMFVLSPSLVVMGASKRWGAFHRGTQLSTAPIAKKDGRLLLTGKLAYPDNLYNHLLANFLGRAFEAAVTAARAEDVTIRVINSSASTSAFEVSWADR